MPTTTNTASKPDSRAKTDAELMEIVRPIVSDYVSSNRNKCWAMVEVAYKVKAALGPLPTTIGNANGIFRDCLNFEYQRSTPGFEITDSAYINDLKLVEKCVKIAYTFSEKELAKKREVKGFYAIYEEIPKGDSKKKKKSGSAAEFAKQLQADADAGVVNAAAYVADVKAGMPVDGLDLKPSKSKSWVAPEVSGKQTFKSYGDDPWRKESLDIIAEKFEEKFIPMIKQALEKELVGSKRQMLKELL